MTRKRIERTLILSLALLPLAMAGSGALYAHVGSTYYSLVWKGDLNVNWAFTPSGSPSLEWRYRVNGGRAQWDALPEPMKFVHRTPSGAADYSADFDPYVCPPVARRNGIHRRSIDGASGVLAKTPACWYSATAELYSFQIVFDTAESWYTGTGTPPSTSHDLWSVAVHEFGHATGFGVGGAPAAHFQQGAFNCDPASSTYNTMCPHSYRGTTRQRTLQDHDAHTFGAVY